MFWEYPVVKSFWTELPFIFNTNLLMQRFTLLGLLFFLQDLLDKQVRQGDECLLAVGKEGPPRHWLPPDLHNGK